MYCFCIGQRQPEHFQFSSPALTFGVVFCKKGPDLDLKHNIACQILLQNMTFQVKNNDWECIQCPVWGSLEAKTCSLHVLLNEGEAGLFFQSQHTPTIHLLTVC